MRFPAPTHPCHPSAHQWFPHRAPRMPSLTTAPVLLAAFSLVPEPRPASASPSAACRGGGAGLAAMALATCPSRSCTLCALSAGHCPPRTSLCTTYFKWGLLPPLGVELHSGARWRAGCKCGSLRGSQ
eukprot:1155396-Pelagomonas_calceolata.AAC.2